MFLTEDEVSVLRDFPVEWMTRYGIDVMHREALALRELTCGAASSQAFVTGIWLLELPEVSQVAISVVSVSLCEAASSRAVPQTRCHLLLCLSSAAA